MTRHNACAGGIHRDREYFLARRASPPPTFRMALNPIPAPPAIADPRFAGVPLPPNIVVGAPVNAAVVQLVLDYERDIKRAKKLGGNVSIRQTGHRNWILPLPDTDAAQLPSTS